MNRSHSSRETGRRRGFTLLELTVSLAILVLILVGVLQLFDANSRLARNQTHIADMQQALRVGQYQLVRTVRMAGRGPVPMNLDQDTTTGFAGKYLPTGIAVEVKDNVAANTHIAGSTSPLVAEGTDVLTVRGVLNGSLYQLNQDTDATLSRAGTSVTGQVVIRGQSPTGVIQNLAAIKEELDKGLPDALLLVSPASDELYAVVQITSSDDSSYDASDIPNSYLTVNFSNSGSEMGTTADDGYRSLTPNSEFPADLTKVAFVGILEEYRYYIRQDAVTTDLGVGPTLRLSRAQVYPGNDHAYAGDDANLREDIADNIRDLQVALGIENQDPIADPDDQVTESDPPDENDEWLFNATADDPTDITKWNGVVGRPNRLYYVRVTTLARTDRPDPQYLSPPIANIEDHVYNEPASPATQADLNQRRFRRRLLTTVIDLRNVS